MGAFVSKLGRSGNGYFEERSFRESELKDPDIVFLDLRSESEFKEKHLRTAIHLPLPEAGANKLQLEKIFSQSGIQQLFMHYHVREDPLCLVLYASQGSYSMQDIPRLLHYHKEFFSSFSHQLYILSDGFTNVKASNEFYFSTNLYEENLQQQKQQQQQEVEENVAVQISECLYLGSMENAKDKEFIETMEIKLLLNVSREMYDPPKDVKYIQIAIEDQGELRFLELLQMIDDIMKQYIENKENVFLFSYEGKSRSVAVALHYLMKLEKWTLYEAYKHIWHVRKDALPSLTYMRFLLEMESLSFPGLPPSLPLRLYILHYRNHEPLDENMTFLDYENVHKKAANAQSSFLESFDFDETALSSPIE